MGGRSSSAAAGRFLGANVTSFNANRGSFARAAGIVEELVGITGSSSILLMQEVGAWRSGSISGRFIFTAEGCPCAVVVPRAIIGIGAHFLFVDDGGGPYW